MMEISPVKACKITRRELVEYLRAFPQKNDPSKDAASELKQKKQEASFLMNGKGEMDSKELFELLQSTQIEEFDAVEEAFKLLDVNDQKYLEIDTFKNIFEKLKLGTIEA